MTREEFIDQFGITPEKCKEIMERVSEIITGEAQEVIEHADYYIDPLAYCDKKTLIEEYGEDALEKDEDLDGYPNLYDYRKQNSAVHLFKTLISYRTHYGGHTSAMDACELMGIGKGWKE